MLPAWPRALDGLRVGLLADLHTGMPHAGGRLVGRAVDALNAEAPDLVGLLGDFVDRSARFARPIDLAAPARWLAALRAPLGVFAVLGNHDWTAGEREIREALSDAGIAVLEDDARSVGRDLWIAGVSDLRRRGALVGFALAGVPEDAAVLLLSHDPDVFPEVPARVALTLSGHLHGGQLRIPLLRRPFVPSRYGERYLAGHVVEGGRHLYVSSGLGTSGVPIRLGLPPEVVVVTLRAQQ